MDTKVRQADKKGILEASGLLKKGQLVAFPTETVYGLGANALNPEAVKAIFEAKGRPQDNPLIVHVLDLVEASRYGQVTPLMTSLADAFWPGPLTLIVARLPVVPSVVSAGLPTVALRAPQHPAARELIRACGLPLAAPSANRSGRPSPTSAQHVMQDLQGRIPLILDGGSCQVGLESTVVDATGEVPILLRPGAVTAEMIALVAGDCKVSGSVLRQLAPGENAPSPGMRHRHYAPKARMTLLKGSPNARADYVRQALKTQQDAWVLAMADNLPLYEGLPVHSLGEDHEKAAHRLFYLLRQADDQGVKRIFAEAPEATGLGLALLNRMLRAAEFDLIQV